MPDLAKPDALKSTPSKIVVMGVTACGKSTLGAALAQALGHDFLEGDAFHPQTNIDAMTRGIALDDAMRQPWLAAIAARMGTLQQAGQGVVASCSALRRRYRAILSPAGDVFFLHLVLTRAEALRRAQARKGHFMDPALVDSQFATLEPLQPEEPGLSVDATLPPEAIIARLRHHWQG